MSKIDETILRLEGLQATIAEELAVIKADAAAADYDEQRMAEKTAANGGDKAADKTPSTNPFKRGEHFSLAEQGRLYSDPKTRSLAISLAKSAGIILPEKPTQQQLTGKVW